jgi:hypothetical protein
MSAVQVHARPLRRENEKDRVREDLGGSRLEFRRTGKPTRLFIKSVKDRRRKSACAQAIRFSKESVYPTLVRRLVGERKPGIVLFF